MRIKLNLESLDSRVMMDGNPVVGPPGPVTDMVWVYAGGIGGLGLGEWNNPANWNQNRIPTSADTLVFNAGTGSINFNTGPGLTSISTLNVKPDWNKTIRGDTLNIFGGVIVDASFIGDALFKFTDVSLEDVSFSETVGSTAFQSVEFSGDCSIKGNGAWNKTSYNFGSITFNSSWVNNSLAFVNYGETYFATPGNIMNAVINAPGAFMYVQPFNPVGLGGWTATFDTLRNHARLEITGSLDIRSTTGTATLDPAMPNAGLFNQGYNAKVIVDNGALGVSGGIYSKNGYFIFKSTGTQNATITVGTPKFYNDHASVILDGNNLTVNMLAADLYFVDESVFRTNITFTIDNYFTSSIHCKSLGIMMNSYIDVELMGTQPRFAASFFIYTSDNNGIIGTFQKWIDDPRFTYSATTDGKYGFIFQPLD